MVTNAATEATEAVAEVIKIPDAMVVVVGIAIVMSVLLVLTGIFYAFGFIMSRASKPKTAKKANAPAAEPAKASAPVAATPAPVVQEGISGEVVAAIAAAVAMMAPEGKRYALKSVSRANGGRPAWAAAGVADNTRPF
ncbi:MAG: OadG family protein [Clostridia bacterium]|nr:OadG family protein [Clostridia bacterium]